MLPATDERWQEPRHVDESSVRGLYCRLLAAADCSSAPPGLYEFWRRDRDWVLDDAGSQLSQHSPVYGLSGKPRGAVARSGAPLRREPRADRGLVDRRFGGMRLRAVSVEPSRAR